MSFSSQNGYVPVSMGEIMNFIRENVNTVFGTDYAEADFVGSNWYRFSYVIAQRMLESENKTAEIFTKLQDYIASTNERIQRPSVSYPGLVDSFEANGYLISVKENDVEDAGTLSVCVDVDGEHEDYAATKVDICNLLKDFVVAGTVFTGDQVESVTLTNGQSFDFKYHLPDETPILLKLTLTISDNNLITVPDDETVRDLLYSRLQSLYRVGLDFEPQRYFSTAQAPYASTVLLEYTVDDGENWLSSVYDADFDEKFTFDLDDLQVIFE
jgi:hypothetical protein